MTVITFGAAFSPMHGWADRLTEEERWDVLRYIRLLAPFNPIAHDQPLPNAFIAQATNSYVVNNASTLY